jgi:hypothetical protein
MMNFLLIQMQLQSVLVRRGTLLADRKNSLHRRMETQSRGIKTYPTQQRLTSCYRSRNQSANAAAAMRRAT